MIVAGYIALWIAAIVGGICVHDGEAWGWFLCVPAGGALLFVHGARLRRQMDDIFGLGQPFFSPTQFIAFKGYLAGLATALAFWGFSIDGWPGRAMQAVASLAILWASFGDMARKDRP